MPHAVYTRDLSRSRSWRKATVRSLAQALLEHERIETTLAKAKETQRFTEKLITLGKKGSLSDRRRAMSLLGHPDLVHRLFSEVAPRFANRPGGYTRIIHGGIRHGDAASMAFIELVELKEKDSASKVKAQAQVESRKTERQKEISERKEKPEEKGGKFLGGLRKFFKNRPEKPE